MTVTFQQVSYTARVKRWLRESGHYLENPPPGCLLAIGAVLDGALVGLCLVGRPVAPRLPQDGSWGEFTRVVLSPALPHGTASAMLRFAMGLAAQRGIRRLIAYHDRTRHTGCIYRKAGMKKDGKSYPTKDGWASREGRAPTQNTPKQRWAIDLAPIVVDDRQISLF